MDSIVPLTTSDEEQTEESERPNLEKVLDDFREQWHQELSKSKLKPEKSKPLSLEEQATNLFLQGTQAEQNGQLYLAIEFYKKAIQLVPDIESKIDFRVIRVRNESECSVESHNDEDEEEDLLTHLQSMSLNTLAICQPNLAQNSTHISKLPVEVIMYILKWVVTSDLDIRSLEMFSEVCQGFYVCARDEELWRSICVKIWGQNSGKLKKYGTWRKMYLERPHLLYNGCYISKSTYYRSGEKSLDGFYQPYHTVEYYRYIRLFPEGKILMACSPDDPQTVIPKLRSRTVKSNHFLSGHYRMSGNKMSAELTKNKPAEGKPSNYYRYKRRNINDNEIDTTYYVEFEISSRGKQIHNILTWKKYSITSYNRSSNKQSVSDIELTRTSFPPMVFSRVKSYSHLAVSPL